MGRLIFTSNRRGRSGLKEALQTIFTAELLYPSRELWLVSPWISNIGVIDDTAGRFRQLNETGHRSINLVDVLTRVAFDGSRVHVVTRPDESAPFVTALRSSYVTPEGSSTGSIRVVERDTLHAKGLAGDDYCIWGSMNLTWSGTSRWEELIEVTDSTRAEEIRDEFRQEYGDDDV